MRGSHPGSFENAHSLRDGDFWSSESGSRHRRNLRPGRRRRRHQRPRPRRTSIAPRAPDARILILDNHDDFGGHAKRNEFHLDGKLHLLNGGTLEIDSPRPYSPVADGLLDDPGRRPGGA